MIKTLIRLRGCAGWSAPLFFAFKKSQGFSCICPYDVEAKASLPPPGYAPRTIMYSFNSNVSFLHIINETQHVISNNFTSVDFDEPLQPPLKLRNSQ